MISYHGVPKPTFHAYRFLHRLGDELLAGTDGAVLSRHRETGKLTLLAYHYPPEVRQAVPLSAPDRGSPRRRWKLGAPSSSRSR